MKCAVLGSPIAHSRSPQLHMAGYAFLGIDWTYERHEVLGGSLATFLATLDNSWAGLSLTMPLKEEGLRLANRSTLLAEQVGGANTLVREDGDWFAHNTDVSGFQEILAGVEDFTTVSILGGGATARAALAALSDGESRVNVFLRSNHRIKSINQSFKGDRTRLTIRDWEDRAHALSDQLLISTTPAGASDDVANAVNERLDPVTHTFIDALYGSWPTPLASALAVKKCEIISGKTLLVYQAVDQLRLMTGIDFEHGAMVEVLLAAVEK
jgi:shikimate dehydrogenase